MGVKYVFCVVGIESFIIYIHCCWSVYIYDILPAVTGVNDSVCQISNRKTTTEISVELWDFSVPECDLCCPFGERCEIVEIADSGRSYKSECVPVWVTPEGGDAA
jgi:hypothetical protein